MADHGITGTHHLDGSLCSMDEHCTWSERAFLAQNPGIAAPLAQVRHMTGASPMTQPPALPAQMQDRHLIADEVNYLGLDPTRAWMLSELDVVTLAELMRAGISPANTVSIATQPGQPAVTITTHQHATQAEMFAAMGLPIPGEGPPPPREFTTNCTTCGVTIKEVGEVWLPTVGTPLPMCPATSMSDFHTPFETPNSLTPQQEAEDAAEEASAAAAMAGQPDEAEYYVVPEPTDAELSIASDSSTSVSQPVPAISQPTDITNLIANTFDAIDAWYEAIHDDPNQWASEEDWRLIDAVQQRRGALLAPHRNFQPLPSF